ncbi:uncharacterized protein LOC142328827 [Lycorma delicatula]|uniref:uncharacterized protein LOC142328827 n=1 Tax=Lycorma delicatula TaxID=130591 RepID=UPI003F5122F2
MVTTKEVAIIGSGVAGLCAARHCSVEENISCVVFEQTSTLGGTWVYTDNTNFDKNGMPVHSAMYRSLRTNLPKEAMSYPDFPHPNREEASYLPARGVLQYLHDYAEHFDLLKYIKYDQQVKRIHPIENDRWELTIVDVISKEKRIEYYDGVMICNGINHVPQYPEIPGTEIFEGKKSHSHNYREPSPFIGLRVLIIGAGPSGLDLTCELSKIVPVVYLSHHTEHAKKLPFAENVILKPDVSSLTSRTVIFKDGTEYEIDAVIFCTGYLIRYPFLSENVKIEVEDNFVKPLYRHLISIEHPTLCIIGLPKHLPVFHLCHIQTQFYLKALTGEVKLPSKEDMHKELNDFIKQKTSEGVRMRDLTDLGKKMECYYNDLANKAGVQNMSSLIVKMYYDAYDRIFKDYMTFRNNCYRIIDNENFNVVDMRELRKDKQSNKCTNSDCRCRALTERNI